MERGDGAEAPAQDGLLRAARVQCALSAHRRLRLYLALLQAGAHHAREPGSPVPDFGRELESAGSAALWLRELPGSVAFRDERFEVPRLARLVRHLGEDLALMLQPLEPTPAGVPEPGARCGDAAPALPPGAAFAALAARVQGWQEELDRIEGERLSLAQLDHLVGEGREHGDGLPRLAQELHRQLVQLSLALGGERVEGAPVRQLAPGDRARVAAFMRGLHRAAPLGGRLPGPGTVAACDGEGLLLQHRIGTRDAHRLALRLQGTRLALDYRDPHRSRFEFFRQRMQELGLQWSQPEPGGGGCHVGAAHLDAPDESALLRVLEEIGARQVFLVGWNRARKRLTCFVAKGDAIQVLAEAAREEVGHLPWLAAGGEQLVYRAMQALGDRAFRIGERLEDVLGREGARAFLLETLRLASEELRQGGTAAHVADATRTLLARRAPAAPGRVETAGDGADALEASAVLPSPCRVRATSRAPARR